MHTIRVLELEASESADAHIRGRLIPVKVGRNFHYEALSYVWGDRSRTESILLQDKHFRVSHNLWLALRRLRYDNKPRFLWVDALCINQENVQERNQQVAMMRHIYHMADRVLVWLGEEADDSHLVFDHLKEWQAKCVDYTVSDLESEIPVYHDSHRNPPPYGGKAMDAFVKLCQRPWFFRTWVITEVSVAKDATVICGADSESFELLGRAGGSKFRTAYSSPRGMDGPSRYRTLSSGIGNQSRRSDIKNLFEYSRFCEASDPKDEVYGLLGLSTQQLVPINYSLSVAEVYRKFTQAIVEGTCTLRVFHWMGVSRRRNDLNSWVQDFSVSKPVGVLPRIYRTWTHSMNFPSRTLPGLQFRSSDLLIRGRYIESIQEVGPEMKIKDGNISGSDGFSETLREWESLATRLVLRKRFKNAVTNAFLDTLIADDNAWTVSNGQAPEFSWQTANFSAWYERYGTDLLAEADSDYFQEIDFIHSWAGKELNNQDGDIGASQYAESMEMVCCGRSFFITDNGSMGLAPPRAKRGDELVYFPGGLYPFVVRRREDGTYELIGDCFLYAFDVYKLFDDKSREDKEFILR
jgi:hypothetical protein